MRLTRKQQVELKSLRKDPEGFHNLYDSMILDRLEQLDPQFVKSLNRAAKGVAFWFA